ncbi:hypothetical protein WKH56_32815 [Priestia sp. SB1]|uniref:hypothetical protein n=1 Tax=Priestia sp. SB1 TaxID=3132359 RepID=UPI00317E2875
MKEQIYNKIEDLNFQILEGMKMLTQAREELQKDQYSKEQLEALRNIVTFYEERLEDLKSQIEEQWNELNKINKELIG